MGVWPWRSQPRRSRALHQWCCGATLTDTRGEPHLFLHLEFRVQKGACVSCTYNNRTEKLLWPPYWKDKRSPSWPFSWTPHPSFMLSKGLTHTLPCVSRFWCIELQPQNWHSIKQIACAHTILPLYFYCQHFSQRPFSCPPHSLSPLPFSPTCHQWFRDRLTEKTHQINYKEHTVIFKSASHNDNGLYYCCAKNAAGHVCSNANFTLNIIGGFVRSHLSWMCVCLLSVRTCPVCVFSLCVWAPLLCKCCLIILLSLMTSHTLWAPWQFCHITTKLSFLIPSFPSWSSKESQSMWLHTHTLLSQAALLSQATVWH